MKRQSNQPKDNTPALAFGQVLKTLREAANMSQERLADKAGYNRTYIGLLEWGKRNPTLPTIINLAQSFNLQAAQLVRKVETMQRRGIFAR